jgi:hypothetical protein
MKYDYDVSYQKPPPEEEGSKKRGHWVKVGVAFDNENGTISVRLDALPLPSAWDGALRLFPKNGDRK